MAMPVTMIMAVMAETVRMIVAVCVAIAVRARSVRADVNASCVPIVRAAISAAAVWRVRHALPKLSVRLAIQSA